MNNLLRNIALLLLLIFTAPAGFASGTGDHNHGDEETVVEETVVEENAPAETHDNSDGHHDAPVEEMMEPAEAIMEPVSHHEDAAPDHHDEPVTHDNDDGHHDEMAASDEHDHSAHEEGTWASNGGERVFAWIGKFHPAATNFPIALLLAAFLAEALFMGSGSISMRAAARFCLWTGALSAVATVLLGWGFVGFDFAEDDSILSAHRWNGTGIAVLGLITLWFGERSFAGKGSTGIYRIALAITAAMVAANGYLGGKMVYGADHYAWPIN